VIQLHDEDVKARLSFALEAVWQPAKEMRPALLEISRAQIEKSKEAYARFKKLVDCETPVVAPAERFMSDAKGAVRAAGI
jgi:hypothetical protein